MSNHIQNGLKETRTFHPSPSFQEKAHISSQKQYQALYKKSIEEPDIFWGDIAEELHWFQKWNRVRNWENPPFAKWFEGGKTNLAYNCLDKHIAAGKGHKRAILWEGEPEGESLSYTYQELHQEVCQFANVLKSRGIQKGDTVAIYLPMIPQLTIAMLACARIGAVHSIIFAGFSAPALAERIADSSCKMVITADGAFRRGKILNLFEIVNEALRSTPSVESCIVVERTKNIIKPQDQRDFWYHDLMKEAETSCPAEELDAEHPLFILYTSGSTGKPKGIQHTTGGYMVGTYLTTKYIFDLQEEDVYWCTADIGWITGHSYVTYGPLNNGATVVMYEGAPNAPDEGRFWRIIEKYKVSVFYTAPTAIRAFMKWGETWPNQSDLSSLRLLGSVGEPINPEAWMWYHRVIGNEKCPIVDTWWQTETGAIMISPLPGITATKPGSASTPFFGVDAAIVDEEGNELPSGHGGLLVIKQPWPSMLRTLYGNAERFKEVYWSKFKKQGWYLVGDGAVQDQDGYIWVLGRIDDVINVSGHRLSTMEVESTLVEHDAVVEAAVIGFKHDLKGEGIAAFVITRSYVGTDIYLTEELRQHVRSKIGAIASPDQIHLVEALPKTRSGKIMRRLLRDLANGADSKGDTSTLEDAAVLHKLKESNK
jgi:acetyl-CoA synthetase